MCVQGRIVSVPGNAREVLVRDSSGTPWTLFVSPETCISDEHHDTLALGDLLPEFEITAAGGLIGAGLVAAEAISVLRAPNIILGDPLDGDTVSALPLVIRGHARVFENTVLYRISALRGGASDRIVGKGFTTARSSDVGRFGPFRIEWYPERGDISSLDADRLLVEVFNRDARDISEINRVARTVLVNLPKPVYLYFPNRLLDPQALDCSKVYPVKRSFREPLRTLDILKALVAGPTESERAQGYATSIPETARVAYVQISGGVLYLDFVSLDAAGSCRIMAIRAQIERTLLANLPISAVVITVRGRSETALQP